MFHVKQARFRLLADAELAEDDVEDVLDIDPAKQATKRGRGPPQFLCGKLLALPDHIDAALEAHNSLLEQSTLPGPADQASLTGSKIVVCEADQGGDQLR